MKVIDKEVVKFVLPWCAIEHYYDGIQGLHFPIIHLKSCRSKICLNIYKEDNSFGVCFFFLENVYCGVKVVFLFKKCG